jgi:hypothetical protein
MYHEYAGREPDRMPAQGTGVNEKMEDERNDRIL